MLFPDLDLNNLPFWLHWVKTCTSTNTWAIHHAHDLQHGDVVFTRHQIAGRGQHGRTWYAPPGVLTASFIVDQLPAAQFSGLSLAIGLAVIEAVEDLLPDQHGKLWLKWPNDVVLPEGKLAGILCEAHSSSNRVIVGIGLNCRVNFAEAGLAAAEVGNAISLHQISSIVLEELVILERLRHHILHVSNRLAQSTDPTGIAAFLPALQDRDILFNRLIRVELAGEYGSEHSIEYAIGQAAGIDAYGRLLLRHSNGTLQAFASGRVVEWIPQATRCPPQITEES